MDDHKKRCRIVIEPEGRVLTAAAGSMLAEVLETNDYPVVLPCGGNGSCGKCLIRFHSGAPDPVYEETLFFTRNQLSRGMRLACLAVVHTDARISVEEIREVAGENMLSSGKKVRIKPDPAVFKKLVTPISGSVADLLSDEQIILGDNKMPIRDVGILRRIPGLKDHDKKQATLTLNRKEVIRIETGDTREKLFGLAVDLGTTTIVISLIDLGRGTTLYLEAGPNPQRRFGDDLISRISYLKDNRNHLKQLSDGVIRHINNVIGKGCREAGIAPEDIYHIVLSGNTVMNHIFLGVDPIRIAQAPYTPVFSRARSVPAGELGLEIFKQAPVFIAPNIGGFVGGDVVSDMLVAGFGRNRKGIRLLIDIGTNCEVVLQREGKIWAASSPAGPALEGACITHGMRAAPGAILDAKISDNDLQVQTIGDETPRGICGSGLFHLVDVLSSMGFVDRSGRIRDAVDPFEKRFTQAAGRIRSEAGRPRSITIFDTIELTQNDIREFQLAKAAIASAWQYLCTTAGCKPGEIDTVYIAGAFGNYIRPQAAIDLGLIPSLDLKRVHFIGNASLEGARMMLLNQKYQIRAAHLAERVNFIELAGRPEFQDIYVENMELGMLNLKRK
jgi:uncharacterized 2Fe-2S/4Fe-4S cluster protein (DUF4445 family)